MALQKQTSIVSRLRGARSRDALSAERVLGILLWLLLLLTLLHIGRR
jgi:hypothetical protein